MSQLIQLGGCKYTTAANMDKNKTWANQDKLKMACVFNAVSCIVVFLILTFTNNISLA